ncbi:MAG: GSCFA domain-containing protein [Rikenellaceae bacterium]
MKFRTPIDITPFSESIDYTDSMLSVGSCFAQSVGGALKRAKFNIEINPCGVLFNPASILSSLERLRDCRLVDASEMEHRGDGTQYHYDFHSSLASLEQINEAVERGHRALQGAQWVVITLGTSWVYTLNQSGAVVANCHKQPSSLFTRRRLSTTEVVGILEYIVETILPDKRVIFTLSPIRHVSDGLADNSLSKATLRVAIDEVVSRHSRRLFYFPSYEILLDDLRDYRFYGEDMVHPSSVAVEYIWELFQGAALGQRSANQLSRVMKVVRATEHRPFDVESESFKAFCRSQLEAISRLEGLEWSEEIDYFSQYK